MYVPTGTMTVRAEVPAVKSVGGCDCGGPEIVDDTCAEQLEVLKGTDTKIVANCDASHSECTSLFQALAEEYYDANAFAIDKDVAVNISDQKF